MSYTSPRGLGPPYISWFEVQLELPASTQVEPVCRRKSPPVEGAVAGSRSVAGIADIGVGQGMIARGIKVLEISGSRRIRGVMAVDA